jgi:hypothetical protein
MRFVVNNDWDRLIDWVAAVVASLAAAVFLIIT